MVNDYIKTFGSALSGTFTGIFGIDLITDTSIVESILGTGDATAIVGLILAGVGGVTIYKTANSFSGGGSE